MRNSLPYIPDIDRLICTACSMDKAEADSDAEWDGDFYSQFLLEHGFIEKTNGVYSLKRKYADIASEDRAMSRQSLWRILEELPICQRVMQSMGKDGGTEEGIVQKCDKEYSRQDIHVVLAWMERLGVVEYKDGSYFWNENETVFEEETAESAYPLDITSRLDITEDKFSVYEYLRKVKRGDVKMNPDFQRNEVWKPEQKSQFIESAILNIPMPPLYFKRETDGQLIVVDGLQRTSALRDFMDGKLTLTGLKALSQLNGENLSTLQAGSPDKQRLISKVEDKMLFFYELSAKTPMSIVYDIFNRINTGGTKLERQEIRNCIFIGHSTRMLKELAQNRDFVSAIDNGITSSRMKDREAILRSIAFMIFDYKKDYGNSIDDILERTMRRLNKMSETEVKDISVNFLSVMRKTHEFYGRENFRIPTSFTRGRINIAVMETITHVFHKLNNGQGLDKQQAQLSIKALLSDQKYLDAVRNSTGSKQKVLDRFNLAKEKFNIA